MTDGLMLFVNPDFEEALIGVTTDNRAVYDYDLMVKSLCDNDNFTVDEAIEFIEFNTIRSLDYMENAPVVVIREEE